MNFYTKYLPQVVRIEYNKVPHLISPQGLEAGLRVSHGTTPMFEGRLIKLANSISRGLQLLSEIETYHPEADFESC
jgi:hypothetical protein